MPHVSNDKCRTKTLTLKHWTIVAATLRVFQVKWRRASCPCVKKEFNCDKNFDCNYIVVLFVVVYLLSYGDVLLFVDVVVFVELWRALLRIAIACY